MEYFTFHTIRMVIGRMFCLSHLKQLDYIFKPVGNHTTRNWSACVLTENESDKRF